MRRIVKEAIFGGGVIIIASAVLYWYLSRLKKVSSDSAPLKETPVVRYGVPRSNPYNNHDDQKHPHDSYDSANNEKNRMIRKDYPGSEKLTVYYNDELGKYFVGRKKW